MNYLADSRADFVTRGPVLGEWSRTLEVTRDLTVSVLDRGCYE